MTAHALDNARERCLDAGMDDYIAKPFAPGDLQARITRLLRAPAGSSVKV
jgi:DNA-binding response OmpR family regulator